MRDIKNYAFDNIEFIAMLSHDLKTPVKAQIRAMNILYSGVFGEFSNEARNLILNIIASNKYMQGLLDNILGEYRIANGIFKLNITKNDLRKTIEDSLCSIGILSEVKGQKIALNYYTDNFEAFYDEYEIQRVIINILSNAFEYGRENSAIDITVEDYHTKLKVQIKSRTGISNIKKTDRLQAGIGLGHIICQKIIELHNGEITYKMTENGEYLVTFIL